MDKRIKTGSINDVKTISFDAEDFFKSCEEKYKMTTKEFLEKCLSNNIELNSEMKLWYKFATS